MKNEAILTKLEDIEILIKKGKWKLALQLVAVLRKEIEA